jgi:hypothetical protein
VIEAHRLVGIANEVGSRPWFQKHRIKMLQ